MTLDEIKKAHAEIRERSIPPVSYKGREWYLWLQGEGAIDTRGMLEDEIDALVKRAFNPAGFSIGPAARPADKPVLLGPAVLEWACSLTEKGKDYEH